MFACATDTRLDMDISLALMRMCHWYPPWWTLPLRSCGCAWWRCIQHRWWIRVPWSQSVRRISSRCGKHRPVSIAQTLTSHPTNMKRYHSKAWRHAPQTQNVIIIIMVPIFPEWQKAPTFPVFYFLAIFQYFCHVFVLFLPLTNEVGGRYYFHSRVSFCPQCHGAGRPLPSEDRSPRYTSF